MLVSGVKQRDSVIYILFHTLFHYGLSQDIACSSLCSTAGPRLSILCVLNCICQSQTPPPSLPHTPFPLGSHKSVVYAGQSFSYKLINFLCASRSVQAHKSTVWQVRHLPQNRELFLTAGGAGGLHLWK